MKKELLFSAFSALTLLLSSSHAAAPDATTADLRSRVKTGDLSVVTVALEAGGDLLVQPDVKDAKPVKMSGVAELKYQEKFLATPATSAGLLRAARYYTQTTATVKVGEKSFQPVLRDQRRFIGASLEDNVQLFSPEGPLTREELDLIEIPSSSLLVERLLPEKRVAIGDTWKHGNELMRAFLELDTVSKSDVTSALHSVVQGLARMQMSGRVEGKISGADVVVEVKGKYQFDPEAGRVNWVGLLIRENRRPGEVAAGTDYVGRIQMQIAPLVKSEHFTDTAMKSLLLDPNPEILKLNHPSADGLWQLTHSRQWFVTTDQRDLTILKLLDKGNRLVQCNASSLPKAEGGRLVTLTQFQDDVKHALGDNFGEFVEAAEGACPAGYKLYRVVVRNTVSELPIQWHYYFLADKAGHQAVLAFTIQGDMVPKLDNADRSLVNSLRFSDSTVASKPAAAKKK